jgi:hypothetical protein
VLKREKHDQVTHSAYNEAGHSIACYHFKVPLISVEIKPDKSGRTTQAVSSKTREQDIMIWFAGPSAEYLCLNEVTFGSFADRNIPFDTYKDLTKIEALELRKQIEKILSQPGYLRAIKTLAEELLNKRFLIGQKAVAIIEKAIGLTA